MLSCETGGPRAFRLRNGGIKCVLCSALVHGSHWATSVVMETMQYLGRTCGEVHSAFASIVGLSGVAALTLSRLAHTPLVQVRAAQLELITDERSS